MRDRSGSFSAILTDAVQDIAIHGFGDLVRLNEWLRRLRMAAMVYSPANEEVDTQIARSLRAALDRAISPTRQEATQRGLHRFGIEQIKPQLRVELDRRIMASAQLIKLNRDQAIESTLRRFAGWASSIPVGGSDVVDKVEIKSEIAKPVRGVPFEVRRMEIDQGHKLAASINAVIAEQTGAIAAIWRSRGRHDKSYDARPEHLARDGKVYAIRDSWAMQERLINKGAGYTDGITQPAEEINCRCYYVYLHHLRNLPQEMLTGRGKYALEETRVRIDSASGFEESEHPRDEDGKFAETGGHGSGSLDTPPVRDRLRKLGMVGTFPPPKGEIRNLKVADLNVSSEDLKYQALMSWDQVTKSGRISRQYRYTQAFHERNAAAKFDRVKAILPHQDAIRSNLKKVMKSGKNEKERQAAAIASVIMETGLRPTDGADSVKHGHYGISSLEVRHARIDGDRIHLDFIGKEGVRNQTIIRDPENVEFMKSLMAGRKGDDMLFNAADSSDAGAILKDVALNEGAPGDIKIKDLRTLKAAEVGAMAVHDYDGIPPPLTGIKTKDAKLIQSAILKMSAVVSAVLNNTPEQARDNYILPEIFTSWQSKLAASI